MSTASQTAGPREAAVLLAAARPILADMGGTLAFYLIYVATGSPRVGALIGLGVGAAQLSAFALQRRSPPALLLVSFALTVGLGSLTLITQDARFLLLKPSLVYGCLGAAMLQKGWLARYLPAAARDRAPPEVILRAGRAWAALMLGTALLNLALVAALPPRTAAGVLTVWATGSKIALFGVQYVHMRRRVRLAARAATA